MMVHCFQCQPICDKSGVLIFVILPIRILYFHIFRFTLHFIPCATESNTHRSILIAFQVRGRWKSSTHRIAEKKIGLVACAHICTRLYDAAIDWLCCFIFMCAFDSETLIHRMYVVCIEPHSINLCGNGTKYPHRENTQNWLTDRLTNRKKRKQPVIWREGKTVSSCFRPLILTIEILDRTCDRFFWHFLSLSLSLLFTVDKVI